MKHDKTLKTVMMSCLMLLLAGIADASTVMGSARILDGDTLIVQGVRIRLEGIDAPEHEQTCQEHGSGRRVSCGLMARAALTELIGHRDVVCDLLRRDRYGRFIGRCVPEGRPGGLFGQRQDLSLAMVASGWAVAYMAEARPEIIMAEQSARLRRLGIWAYVFERPSEFRARGR